MTQLGYLVFLIATFPVVIYMSWSDLKFMRIPNKANILLFGIFVVLGLFFIPLPEYGIRLLQAVGVLFFFFLLNAIGLIGGGDAKLFAALSPYIWYKDVTVFLFMLSFLALAAVAVHRIIKRTPLAKTVFADWQSWSEKGKFPFGLPLATSLSAYFIYFLVT